MRYLLLALVLAGCGSPTEPVPADPVVIYGQRPMGTVPAIYATWYAEVEVSCGATGDATAVAWMAADSIFVDGLPYTGHFMAPHTLIVHTNYLTLESAVKHLMAHHVLQSESEPACG